jgi:hypothetical protein
LNSALIGDRYRSTALTNGKTCRTAGAATASSVGDRTRHAAVASASAGTACLPKPTLSARASGGAEYPRRHANGTAFSVITKELASASDTATATATATAANSAA